MNVFEAAAAACRIGRPAALATVIAASGSSPRSTGARMLVHEDGSTVGTIGGGAIEHRVIALALESVASGVAVRLDANLERDLGMVCGGAMEVYIEPLEVQEPAVLFGAGHVALATAPLLRELGFAVTVVDERPELATEDRFPGCTLHTNDPLAFARDLEGSSRAFWLIVSHRHDLDEALAEILLDKKSAWLGMIGSRVKVRRFRKHLIEGGFDPARLDHLSAPVGLDIGAETPAEIAVSIAAEVVRTRRSHTADPVPLREHLASGGGPKGPCPES